MTRFDRSRQWEDAQNIVLSQDFLPQIGGAHSWLYECYKRWSSPVHVLTRTHSRIAPIAHAERDFDRGRHDSIDILREIPPSADQSLLSLSYLQSNIRQLRSIRRVAGSGRVILHCLRAFPDGFGGALYKLLQPRSTLLVVYAHGEEVLIANTSRQLRFMARHAYSGADLIIVNSESTRRLVNELCPNRRMVCVHPGVDPASFEVSAEEAVKYRAAWGWPSGTIVIATIARMERRKNHRMMIRVLEKLRAEGLPLAFVCAGEGEERVHLEEMIAGGGLQPWILFPGAISEREKRLLLAACDIHAMPSIQVGEMIEGFGIVFLEA